MSCTITMGDDANAFPGLTFETVDGYPSQSKGWIRVFAYNADNGPGPSGILLYRDRWEAPGEPEGYDEEFWAFVPSLPQLDSGRRYSAEAALSRVTEAAAKLFWQLLEAL